MRKFLESGGERDSGGLYFGGREFLAEHQQSVQEDRQEEKKPLEFPANDDAPAAFDHQVRKHSSKNETCRPTGVENVQVVRLLFGIKRGGKRIDDRFASSIGQREQRHAGVEQPE